MQCRTKGLLGFEEAGAAENGSGCSATSVPRLKFPSDGWKQLADVRGAAEVSLGLSMGQIVAYFVAGRAVDGLQREDFRNLSGEAFGSYQKSYGREGELCVLADKLYFRSVMSPAFRFSQFFMFSCSPANHSLAVTFFWLAIPAKENKNTVDLSNIA